MSQTLFTVGPVEMYEESLRIGGEQLPYFRTPEFSRIVIECDQTMRALADAPMGSRTVFLTSSGTGAMEAAVINTLSGNDRALIVAGGSFGQRFCEICDDNEVPYDVIRLDPGKALDLSSIESADLGRYKALLINAHETSTGLLYDIERIGALCRGRNLLFIVDAISAFLCDTISMERMGIDILITSSQKALALAPGLSILVFGPRAIEAMAGVRVRSHYFGLSKYLADASRGQTPFTPAVGVVLQLHERLATIGKIGADGMVRRTAALARHFRESIAGLPYRMFPERPSNALTALSPLRRGISAYDVYSRLKDEYGLIVTPNGGQLKDTVFRVGHMGNLCEDDLDVLATALREISA